MDTYFQDADAFWALFETAPDTILVFEARGEPRGRIVAANQRAVLQFGFELGELRAMTVMDLDAEAGRSSQLLDQLVEGEELATEVMRRRKDGSVFASDVRARLVDSGDRAVVVAFERDVTSRYQAEEERRLNARRLDSLLELSHRSREMSEDEIIQAALEEAATLTSSAVGYLHFVDVDQRSIDLRTWTRATPDSGPAASDTHDTLGAAGIWADSLRLERAVIHNADLGLHDRKGHPEGRAHLVRHASAPIMDGGRVTLVIGVGNKPADYDAADARQLVLIGDQLVRILQRKRAENALLETNLRLRQQLAEIERLKNELREQATRDALTGLFNRRHLAEVVERELARALREGYAIAVVMIDIDHFKSINDTYGHQAGDEVLRAFAELLRGHARRGDLLCRYGGEEFVVLMPRAGGAVAASRAEEWRAAFERLRVPHEEHALGATLSVGVAVLSPSACDVEAVLKDADAALYRSKAEGRNRVTVFDGLGN